MPQRIQLEGKAEDSSDNTDDEGNEEEEETNKNKKFESKYLEGEDAPDPNAKLNLSKNRLFKYLLTDGVREIVALELEPIHQISLEGFLPGSKLRLIGPIEVRRGIWMLKRPNVETLWSNEIDKNMVPKTVNFTAANTAIL